MIKESTVWCSPLSIYHCIHCHIMRFGGYRLHNLFTVTDPNLQCPAAALRKIPVIVTLAASHPCAIFRKSHTGHNDSIYLTHIHRQPVLGFVYAISTFCHRTTVITVEIHHLTLDTRQHHRHSLCQALHQRPQLRLVTKRRKERNHPGTTHGKMPLHLTSNGFRTLQRIGCSNLRNPCTHLAPQCSLIQHRHPPCQRIQALLLQLQRT